MEDSIDDVEIIAPNVKTEFHDPQTLDRSSIHLEHQDEGNSMAMSMYSGDVNHEEQESMAEVFDENYGDYETQYINPSYDNGQNSTSTGI